MNILYISHEIELGGASMALLELIDEMILKGNKVFVTAVSTEGAFYEELSKRKVDILIVNYYYWVNKKLDLTSKVKFILKNIVNVINAIKISSKIKNNKIDLIHTNTSVVNFGLLISKFTGIPHVFHIREFADTGLNFKYFLSKNKCLNFANKYSKKIIVISKALYNENLKNYNKEKLELIYDGIQSRDIKEKSKNITCFKLMIVGDVAPHKRTKDVVLAVNNLVKRGYDEITLLIVGNGDEEYVQELNEIIHGNSLERNITIMGFNKDVNALRKDISVEIVCSGSEGFGRCTVEAMFSMNPVIGANNSATGELVVNNYNGLLYKTGDYNELAEKIKYFMDNPSEIKRMGNNGYSYAHARFTLRKNTEEICHLYNKVLL